MTLRARGLSVAVPGRVLVDGLDLAVAPGTVLSVEGPSGSGKTSLLRVFALLDPPAAGAVETEAGPVDDVPAFRRRHVYVPQRPVVCPGSVEDNLRRAFGFGRSPDAYEADRARTEWRGLGLEHDLAVDAEHLSQGERQRLALVRALLLRPAALFLDEPTSALDEDAVVRVETRLRAFVDAGGAVVLVSHDPGQRERLATARLEVGA